MENGEDKILNDIPHFANTLRIAIHLFKPQEKIISIESKMIKSVVGTSKDEVQSSILAKA